MPAVIDQHRQNWQSQIISMLYEYIEECQGETLKCNFDRDAMFLGMLTKDVRFMRLLAPPGPPFICFSFRVLAQKVCELQFEKSKCRRSRSYYDGHLRKLRELRTRSMLLSPVQRTAFAGSI